MNPSIFILEDNITFARNLIETIRTYPIKLDYTLVSDLNTALDQLDHSIRYAAFFVDISLNEAPENTDGLSFAEYISESSTFKDIPIIFTTSFPNYVYEALNRIHCYAYLLKPFQPEDIFYQLDQILKTNKTIRLKTADGIFMKLSTNDIYYIQAFGRTMFFTTAHGEISSRQYTMKSLNELLPDYFKRCHKSFLVNTKYIQSVNPKNRTLCLMDINDEIPYGRDFHIH